MTDSNRAVGNEYENIAVDYLKDLGYSILARNFTSYQGEIDIVAMDPDKNEIVFVEVKYRKSNYFGGANSAISRTKIARVRSAAKYFLLKNGYKADSFCRFDAVLITGKNINHIKNAF